MLKWIVHNWWYSIPIGAAGVYLLCSAWESAAYKKLGIKTGEVPAKQLFPRAVTLLEALAVFFFLLWYNCGAVFWRRGWRPLLLLAFVLCLGLLAVVLSSALRRLSKAPYRQGRPYPRLAIRRFCLRRTVGSFIPAWFVGFWPAAVFQSIGLKGVDGTVRLIFSLLLPGLLPLLFLLAIWLLSGQPRAIIDGRDVPPPPEEEKKEKSFADLMYEAQMADLIERGIREEEEENERKYREYWEDKYRK